MSSKLWGLLFFSMLGLTVSAQNVNLDSLKQLIDANSNDLVKVKKTNELVVALTTTQPDSAMKLLQGILPVARSLKNEILVDVYYRLGEVYEARQLLDSALLVYDETIDLAKQFSVTDPIVNSLIQQGYIYAQKGDLEKCLGIAQKAYVLATNTAIKKTKIRAANNLGRSFSFMAKFDSSNHYLREAIKIEETIGADKQTIAELYINIGNNYGRAQQTQKAIEEFNKALDLMKQAKDSTGTSIAYRSIGVAHFFTGQYPKALENLHLAVDALENTKYYDEHITNLDFLGEVYFTIEDYNNAEIYWERAIETWQKAHDDQQNPDLLFKKGRVLLLQENYQKALDILLLSESIMKKTGQHINGDWYWHIGQAYEMLQDYEQAQKHYNLAIKFSPGVNSPFIITRSLFGLGQIQEKNRQFDQAQSFYQRAYEVAIKNGLKENEMLAAEGLYRMYKKNRNSDQALYFHEIAKSIQDSLYNEKNTEEITRMQSRFEFEQEKQELAYDQAKELERQSYIRRMLWIALALAGVLLFIGFLYYRAKQKANQQLSQLNEKILLQKEKLEELDQIKSHFFTNISHEFRTPLTVILGILEKTAQQPEKWLKEGKGMIQRNAENLLNLVNQILDLRKLESGKLALNLYQADIVPYLHFIFSSFQSFGEHKKIQLHWLSNEASVVMDYDQEKLLRVISNLLSNAIKFTPEKGHVYFLVNKEHIPPGNNSIEQLSIQIKDTGVGIPLNEQSKIFNQFYQLGTASNWAGYGTGIGLAICKELVVLMGGEIQVESKEGEGSIFTIKLPITNLSPIKETPEYDGLKVDALYVPKANTEEVTPLVKTIDEGSSLPVVLIVDDNKDILHYLIACLEGQYQLVVAKDGQEGVNKALEVIPDVIISDVMMPEKNGYELCHELKTNEKTSHIPIILLTAKASEHSKIEGLQKGADAYLTKPFREEELLIRLNNMIESQRKMQKYYQQNNTLSTSDAPAIQQEDEFLQKIRTTLEARIDDSDYGIVQICRDIGMSRAQLHRKLKALTGQSASIYLRRIRLHKAKILLETTDFNSSQTAYAVGFRHPSYFAKLFLEEFGYSPHETRK